MVQATTTRTAGTSQSGTYQGTIPNPVASSPMGTSKTVYYLITATDHDDASGNCDLTTQAPASGTFSVAFTNPGGGGTLKLCDACTADAQCSGTNNLCVVVGTQGKTFCGQWCGDAGAPACPTSYTCSTGPLTSTGGTSKRQCQPSSGACGPPMAMCVDDNLEPNDSRTNIGNATAAALPPGTYNLAYCPGSGATPDEDWYGVPITGDTNLSVTMGYSTGMGFSDLDLELVDGSGNVIASSLGVTGTEMISYCVPGTLGKVFLRVFTFDSPPVNPNVYDMTLSKSATTCTCSDTFDPNGNAGQAVPLFLTPSSPTVSFGGLQICTGEQDWFTQDFQSGDTITVDLTFNQTNALQDLDVHLIAPDGTTDLTPCSVSSPTTCLVNNGQGSMSNEHFVWNAFTNPTPQPYYIVIEGYNNSANSYAFAATLAGP
jgi:hypothetical protein